MKTKNSIFSVRKWKNWPDKLRLGRTYQDKRNKMENG